VSVRRHHLRLPDSGAMLLAHQEDSLSPSDLTRLWTTPNCGETRGTCMVLDMDVIPDKRARYLTSVYRVAGTDAAASRESLQSIALGGSPVC
jgi:hypothetical protein